MTTILVVDDDPAFLPTLVAALQNSGYGTIEATSARDGLHQARTRLPDLILSDIVMTAGTGFNLLADLQADPLTANIPVILMSGGSDVARARQSMGLGADDFLEKPFKLEWLIATIEAQLKKHEKIRREAAQTKARLVAMLEAIPDFVGIMDPKSRAIVYLNPAGRRMIGIADETQIAQHGIQELYPPVAVDRLENEALPAAVRDGSWRGELTLRTLGGGEVPVAQLIQAHSGANGGVEFFSLLIHDLTEERRIKAERQNVENQLRNAQKLESLGRLAAGIAHEINTPTQYIGDNIRFLEGAFRDLKNLRDLDSELFRAAGAQEVTPELLARIRAARASADLDYLDVEIPKALQQSLVGVDRITRLVRAMEEFSRADTREKGFTDINRAIETTLMVCRNEWKYVAEVSTHFQPDLPPVPCFAGSFHQVILTLVVNAAQAIAGVVGNGSRAMGTIAIATQRMADWAEIRIKDSGTGIPASAQEHLFEPSFFMTRGVGKGTGQGLALAHFIVCEKHGGTLDYETEEGRGTTFVIRLPYSP